VGEVFIVEKSFTQRENSEKKDYDNAESEKSSGKEDKLSEDLQGSSQSSEAFFESILKGSEGCLWMTIGQLMTRDLVTVNEETHIEEVFSIFVKNPYHILPVVNEKKELTGIIDLDTILDILLLCLMPRERYTPLTARKSLGEKAKEIMVTHPVTVSLNSTLKDASDIMMKNRSNQVCVSEDGKLVGILSKRDLVDEICRRRKKKA
jgi:CBS domain-containing protein